MIVESAPTAPGLHPVREVALTVVAAEMVTADIRILRLSPAEPFAFRAGQYANLSFGGLPGRDFSIASRPSDPVLEFHVRDHGTGASRYAVRQLRVGERVGLRGPLGSAVLQDGHAGPILAIAGGSGLAPMKSIVEEALARGHQAPVYLYFGARGEADLYGAGHFAALAARHANFRFVPVLSEPAGPTAHRTGYVGDAVAADFPRLEGFKAYLAGPPVMVESAAARLLANGMAGVDIHGDAFYTETDKQKRAAAG